MSDPTLTGMPSTPHASSSKSPLRIVSNPHDEEPEEESPALSSTASSPSTDDELRSPTSPSTSSDTEAEIFDDRVTTLPRNPKLVITPNTPSPDPAHKSKLSSPLRSPTSPARRLTRLSPLSSLPAPPQSTTGAKLGMPKSQPLARTLYARMGNGTDVPHAGLAGGAKRGAQKLIVPKKAFKTTFCLDLTASEFARTA